MHQLPNQSGGEMDSETFLLMGFMVLPMLFVMFGLMQRMQGRRRELPAPPVSISPPCLQCWRNFLSKLFLRASAPYLLIHCLFEDTKPIFSHKIPWCRRVDKISWLRHVDLREHLASCHLVLNSFCRCMRMCGVFCVCVCTWVCVRRTGKAIARGGSRPRASDASCRLNICLDTISTAAECRRLRILNSLGL